VVLLHHVHYPSRAHLPTNELLHRRWARFLIKQAQGFADEPLVAVANFTWVGNSMGAQPGVRGRGEWAGGLPDWTLIGAGANRVFVIAAHHARPDKGTELIGSWPLAQVQNNRTPSGTTGRQSARRALGGTRRGRADDDLGRAVRGGRVLRADLRRRLE
jgi:hypothetical protein